MGWINRGLWTLTLVVVCSTTLTAQTWSEWFSQKKTQQKYLLEQIAALKLYAGYAKKGYEIGKSGLGFIKDVSKGEFDLHNDFFNSLKNIGPEVRKYPGIAEIILMQVQISRIISMINKNDIGHSDYLKLVNEALIQHCTRDLDELQLVITTGKLEMEDDERIRRIDKIHKSMLEKWTFATEFERSVRFMGLQKAETGKELKKIGGLYGDKDL